MTILQRLLGNQESDSSHKWEKKRTYDLPGPRINPEVTVSECTHCGMVMETSRWHDPNPQYFENDTRDAERVTDSDVLSECVEGETNENDNTGIE